MSHDSINAFKKDLLNLLRDDEISRNTRAFAHERRGLFSREPDLVAQPLTVSSLIHVVTCAYQRGIQLVPRSGGTGLVGGHIPLGEHEVVVSLHRLNRIRSLSKPSSTMTLEAGVTLEEAQRAAQSIDRFFPLALPSQKHACLGGNLSTNAGGMNVVRYGTVRDLTLGLEVVLADGTLLSDLRPLRKKNEGLDWKHLFIGSEGTLGIVTAASVRLFATPLHLETLWIPLTSPQEGLDIFHRAQELFCNNVQSFELLSYDALTLALKHPPSQCTWRPPRLAHSWFAVCEVCAPSQEILARFIAYYSGIINAKNLTERNGMWALRAHLSDAQKEEGASIKNDIGVPLEAIPLFIEKAEKLLKKLCPKARPIIFGHIGDGNIHFDILAPPGVNNETFLRQWDALTQPFHRLAREMGGTMSAEHGIGQLKSQELNTTLDTPLKLLMRTLKATLDPKGILNPGKVLPSSKEE